MLRSRERSTPDFGAHTDQQELARMLVAIDNILEQMAKHHYKKSALFSTLHSWRPE